MRRALLAAVAAAVLVSAGCSRSGDGSEDGAVDTTLNDDAGSENLAADDSGADQNLAADENLVDGEYAPEAGSGESAGQAGDGTGSDAMQEQGDEESSEGSARAVSRSGSLAALFSNDDYPASALSNGEEGAVTANLDIDERGRVSACAIVRSSGSAALDSATCNILTRRALHAREGRRRRAHDR